MLFQSYRMKARSDKAVKNFCTFQKPLQFPGLYNMDQIKQEAHSARLNGFSEVLRTRPNPASSLPVCHHAVTPAGKSELAFLHISKFRYVSVCPGCCVLNEYICHMTYITHTQLSIFSFLLKMGKKVKHQEPQLINALCWPQETYLINSWSLNANLQGEHFFSLKSVYIR